jgi:predicted HAD superfamily Cof-like phosphohydrolase
VTGHADWPQGAPPRGTASTGQVPLPRPVDSVSTASQGSRDDGSDAYARGWNDCAATVSAALAVTVLPSITDGIADAEAEASATFDLTIDEVRALKDKRESPARLVRQFHETFGVPIQDIPGPVTEELAQARQGFLESEVAEVAEGVANGDLANIAQELADVVYVAYGTALAYGIDLDAVLAEVHRANMSKLDADGRPLMRADGKVLKSPLYRPPDVAAVLAMNGARP